MPHCYPLLLDVSDRWIVIVGGGEVAVRKVRGLIDAGATRVRVIAPAFHERMPAEVQRVASPYRREHLADANLIFAATDDPATNDAIVRDAHALKILVCRADADQSAGDFAGDFATPAMIRRGPVLVTVSTGGSPALAARLRDQIEKCIDAKWIAMADLMQTLRPTIHAIESLAPARRREIFLDMASDDAMNTLQARGRAGLIDWLKDRYPELRTLA
jgi:precorrin-2 dehydrogenase/sirohydrochlorin ferrochelatase